MKNSYYQSLACLLAVVCLAKAENLKIRSGIRSCLSWSGSIYPSLKPDDNKPTRFYACFNRPKLPREEGSWTRIPGPNDSFNICIDTTNMCLGLEFNIRNNKVEYEAIVRVKNDEYPSQQWKYDGTKLTNVRMGPNFCAQAESYLIMVPCNVTEPKQKFEIGEYLPNLTTTIWQ